jgi:prolyl 4-hydroxylase
MAAPKRHPLLDQAFALSKAGRDAEAVLLINRLAAENEPGALFTLAEMKWRGGMVSQDLPAARELYRRASEAGQVQASQRYTNLLASGIAGPRNWPLAMKRLKEEARADPARKTMREIIQKMALTPDGDPISIATPERLSDAPEVSMTRGLLTPAECDWLRKAAEPLFAPCTVNDAQGREVLDPIRQSDGATFHWLIEDPAIHAITRRLAAISGTDAAQGEALQILRYRPGQQYRPHLDYVRPELNPRVLTVLVWLNHDYEGGETHFGKVGLSVKGRKGDALTFRNANDANLPEPLSEHAGQPVTRGTKYLASRWIRNTRWMP